MGNICRSPTAEVVLQHFIAANGLGGKVMDYSANFEDEEVPDPYYGQGHAFDLVLDMIEDAAQGLVGEIKKTIGGKPRS